MRISDWSSDVCSSDLRARDTLAPEPIVRGNNSVRHGGIRACRGRSQVCDSAQRPKTDHRSGRCWRLPRIWPADPAFFLEAASNDTRIACFTRDQIERLAVLFASIAKLRAAMMRTGGRVD